MKVYSILSYIDLLKDAGLLIKSDVVDNTLAIEHITYNSKDTREYTLFACKGAAFKPQYFDEAINNNIACYMSEILYETKKPVSNLIVNDIRRAMALVANAFHDHAFEKLKLVGITGTKGKSTTAYYIKYILDEYLQSIGAKPSGIVSSIEVFDGKVKKEAHLTTPEAFELHEHLGNAVDNELEYFALEVSSQALKYDRVLDIAFDVGVFLNISEDHISPIEHSDFEDYLTSKLKLFSQSKLAIVNLNSDMVQRVLDSANASDKVMTFGLDEKADYYGYSVTKQEEKIKFNCKSNDFDTDFTLTMPGLFNVENALAAIAVCHSFHIPLEHMKNGLAKARSNGRMEIYATPNQKVVAIVDYAHNKLSFEKLFQSTLEEYNGRKIITVFGCPGNKAYNRRKELGELAGKYSDCVYLTADDPGFEKVGDINNEIKKHLSTFDCECYMIEDRSEAIKTAIFNAPENSIVLVAGKGNDSTHKVNGKHIPYETDAFFVKKYLQQLSQPIKLNE